MTVMGDAAMERFSDRGSIPLSSIRRRAWNMSYFMIPGFFCTFFRTKSMGKDKTLLKSKKCVFSGEIKEGLR